MKAARPTALTELLMHHSTCESKSQGHLDLRGGEIDSLIERAAKNSWPFLIYHKICA